MEFDEFLELLDEEDLLEEMTGQKFISIDDLEHFLLNNFLKIVYGEEAETEDINIVGITLGDKVRDRITGLVGITTAKIDYIFGCQQFRVTPITKDNKPVKGDWIDTPQLEILEKQFFKKDKPKKKKEKVVTTPHYGGERDHPDDEEYDDDYDEEDE